MLAWKTVTMSSSELGVGTTRKDNLSGIPLLKVGKFMRINSTIFKSSFCFCFKSVFPNLLCRPLWVWQGWTFFFP